MTGRIVLWTYEDEHLPTVTDVVNVKLGTIDYEGGVVALGPVVTVSAHPSFDGRWYVAQITYRAGAGALDAGESDGRD